jgi:cyclophilin family peptidyl-prolyl cis-trans isomerase
MLAAQKRRARQRRIAILAVPAALIAFFIVRSIVTSSGGDNKTKVAATTEGAAPCPKLTDQPRVATFKAPQRKCINTKHSYHAKIETDAGTFTVALDTVRAPTTVNNFVVLARYHFYDGLTFHRVVQDFGIQGGDPEGTGRGGPGYNFADESLAGTSYPAGSIAMANSGPNTNGSQFFVVTTDAGGKNLQPLYNRFGTVTAGMDVVKKIGQDAGEPPTTIHKIIKVTIEES